MEGVPEKPIFRSVTVYNKNLSSPYNLAAQIEQVQDKANLSSQCNFTGQTEQVQDIKKKEDLLFYFLLLLLVYITFLIHYDFS